MSLNLLKDDFTSAPPSVSNVNVNTSVETVSFSLALCSAALGAPAGNAAEFTTLAGLAVGTCDAPLDTEAGAELGGKFDEVDPDDPAADFAAAL